MVRTGILRHIPFELDAIAGREGIDFETTRQPQRGVGHVRHGRLAAGAILAFNFDALDLGLPHGGPPPRALKHTLWCTVRIDYHPFARREIARERQLLARGVDEAGVAMNVDVRGIDAVLGGKAPVAVDGLVLAVGIYREILVEEARLQV